MWWVAANILNKQSGTADTGWSSILGVGRGTNNSSRQESIMLRNVHTERQGQVAGTCKCGNEPSGCIKCGEFLD